MFIGPTGLTTDRRQELTAMGMAQQGKPREEIYGQTGFFSRPDGKMRWELPDDKAALKSLESGKLGDVLDHSPLFEAYPWLKDVPVKFETPGFFDATGYGYETPEGITIAARDKNEALRVLIHEVQHRIQRAEGFGTGGLPGNYNIITDPNAPISPEAYEAHSRLPGEAESYAVQARQFLTNQQRAARPPWLDYKDEQP